MNFSVWCPVRPASNCRVVLRRDLFMQLLESCFTCQNGTPTEVLRSPCGVLVFTIQGASMNRLVYYITEHFSRGINLKVATQLVFWLIFPPQI